ncbi:MAG: M20/M25/M40 family metallo-hydrolase [Candidatus Thermoplasmatota archaeon]|nr:M20/M25/M40 family metallo-hydrolase [Candidatus Thermoplasmatota archaeon]
MLEMREFIEENLRKMVKIESKSEGPMEEIIEFTTSLLDDINLDYEVIEGEDFNPVIVASYGEGGVCFSGHLDTVPIGDGWEHEQGEIVEDKMYGRGTLDMKGPCVSVISTAEKLIQRNVPFSIVFTTDEENTMNGAEHVSERPEVTKASAVLVCEPTDMRVVNQEKGVYQFEILTEGKNAHASMPEKGENAIVKILPILESLSRKNNIPAGQDEMSCCVDVIEGGEATNVIPDSCRAEVDVRFPDHFDKEILEKYLFDPIDEEFELKEIQFLESVKLDEGKESVQTLIKIADAETWAVPYGTEMVRFCQNNENTIIFGPGRVDVAHQPDEYIDLPELVKVVDVYIDYAESMADTD